MDRQEVWEHVIEAIEREFLSGEFEDGEFSVAVNVTMGTITITSGGDSFTLLNATGGYFTGGNHDSDPITCHLPSRTLAALINERVRSV